MSEKLQDNDKIETSSAAGENEEGNTTTTTKAKTTTFIDLPMDALGAVLDHCTNFKSILNLSESNKALKQTIIHQNWNCQTCSDSIFMDGSLATTIAPRRHTDPFICGVCHNKFCGDKIDYDKRYCRVNKCDGCGKLVCHDCLHAHLSSNEDGYGTEDYCADCQDEFDFGMGGC